MSDKNIKDSFSGNGNTTRNGASNLEDGTDFAWLSALVDSAADAIISKTPQGFITSWNKEAERLFGYTAEEVTGKTVLMLIPPELRDEEKSILEKINKGGR